MEEKIITRRDSSGRSRNRRGGDPRRRNSGGRPVRTAVKVVLIRNAGVLGENDKIQPEILQSMLDEAVKSLLGTDEPLEAGKGSSRAPTWWGSRAMHGQDADPKELEAAIHRRLLDAGIAGKNIDIGDREY